MAGGMRHTKWMRFKAPDLSTFVQSLWKYYWPLLLFFKRISGHLHLFDQWYRNERMKVFHFGKIWCFCSQRRRKVFFMADVICICIETVLVHQNLNILYVSGLYILPRSSVNPFPCDLCWKMNWNTKITYFELFMCTFVYITCLKQQTTTLFCPI